VKCLIFFDIKIFSPDSSYADYKCFFFRLISLKSVDVMLSKYGDSTHVFNSNFSEIHGNKLFSFLVICFFVIFFFFFFSFHSAIANFNSF